MPFSEGSQKFIRAQIFIRYDRVLKRGEYSATKEVFWLRALKFIENLLQPFLSDHVYEV